METIFTLVNLVSDVQREGKSGVVMVTAMAGADNGQTFTLRFDSGELVRASGPSGLTGSDALITLSRLEHVQQMRWMPLNPSSGTPKVEVSGREVAEIFGFSRSASVLQQELNEQQQANARLISRAEEVLRQFYIGDYEAELRRIRAEHPPEQQPKDFLLACAQLLTPLIGKEETRKLLLA